MKQRKHRTKILSFVLSVLMLLGVPLPAFAQAAVENAIEEAQNQPVLMTDKLTETETYWQNADGSITYESHLEPIRYKDEAGSWHEIVNDVVQVDKSVESTDAFKEEPYDYRSESSKSWVLLDEDIRSDHKRQQRRHQGKGPRFQAISCTVVSRLGKKKHQNGQKDHQKRPKQ